MENLKNSEQAGTSQDTEASTIEVQVEGQEDVFKTFKTQEEFDKHAAGIKYSAKEQATKELLKTLGMESMTAVAEALAKAGMTDSNEDKAKEGKDSKVDEASNEALKMAQEANIKLEALQAELASERLSNKLMSAGVPTAAVKYLSAELLADDTGLLADDVRLKEYLESHELVRSLMSTPSATKADPNKHVKTPNKPTIITGDMAKELESMFK